MRSADARGSAFSATHCLASTDDQSQWENDPRFSETIYVDRVEKHFAILSADAENDNPIPNGFGRLISEVSGELIDPFELLGLVDLGGDDQNSIISTLFGLDAAYDDQLQYDLTPDIGDDEYNSNSYVAGLIDALTLLRPTVYYTVDMLAPNTPAGDYQYTGWHKPLPISEFGL